MEFKDAIKKRLSVYGISDELPVSDEALIQFIEETATWVPDAFNMQSQRVMVLFGEKHLKFWDMLNEYFDNKINPDKLAGFKAGRGTILLFWEKDTVENMQKQLSSTPTTSPLWAEWANACCSLPVDGPPVRHRHVFTHYNPCFDAKMREEFDIPETWVPTAQMPFAGRRRPGRPKR